MDCAQISVTCCSWGAMPDCDCGCRSRSKDLLAWQKATCNTRYNEHGIVRSGPQVMLGANDSYVALCRRHFKLGMLGPDAEAKEQCAE